jgi:hypothetical protein
LIQFIDKSLSRNQPNAFNKYHAQLASLVIIGPLAVLGFLDQGEIHERQEI